MAYRRWSRRRKGRAVHGYTIRGRRGRVNYVGTSNNPTETGGPTPQGRVSAGGYAWRRVACLGRPHGGGKEQPSLVTVGDIEGEVPVTTRRRLRGRGGWKVLGGHSIIFRGDHSTFSHQMIESLGEGRPRGWCNKP